jgi:lipoprotein LprG
MPLRRLVPVLMAGLLLVTGCSSGSKSNEDPATRLKTAQHKLEDTSGVTISLTTSDLPGGVQGPKSASGTVTDAPAFDGTLGVVTQIGSFSVPVRSVGGKVYAQIPLTTGWSVVNPSEYGAPDPAELISADKGVPSLLAATQNPKSGKDIRGGTDNKEVLSTITGTVPASAVSAIIPSASGSDFDATYALTSDDELRQVALTGEFYSGHPENTYTLVLTDYGTSKDISAP